MGSYLFILHQTTHRRFYLYKKCFALWFFCLSWQLVWCGLTIWTSLIKDNLTFTGKGFILVNFDCKSVTGCKLQSITPTSTFLFSAWFPKGHTNLHWVLVLALLEILTCSINATPRSDSTRDDDRPTVYFLSLSLLSKRILQIWAFLLVSLSPLSSLSLSVLDLLLFWVFTSLKVYFWASCRS